MSARARGVVASAASLASAAALVLVVAAAPASARQDSGSARGAARALGSSHCTLAPYWSERLGKRKLHALQLSQRGGELWCEDLGDRIRISARALRRAEGVLDV
jgi:predicted PhzF superfamily epimerase YddE/YHI9